jgi:ferredoxin-type protein NapF
MEEGLVATVSRRGLFRALKPFEQAPPESDVQGARIARFSETCVELRGVVCRRCGDSCHPRAIAFRIQTGGTAHPHLASERCTGCGDCLPVCPTNAITLIPAERAAVFAALAATGHAR